MESNVQLCDCVLNTSGTEHGVLDVGDDSSVVLAIFGPQICGGLQIRTVASKFDRRWR